tara:strand:- start:61 stop:1338 length:1278 start_codon:yes stop_codon:yes gene_type:complete
MTTIKLYNQKILFFMIKNKSIFKTLGPGILFATTAIGVSHLVQSTRAGAEYGLIMLVFILSATIFKYPFFEFGSRYANITGTSLLDGYFKLNKWILVIYLIITFLSMFIVTAAVAYVTSGLLMNLLQISINIKYIVLLVMLLCAIILFVGKFNLLDSLVKIISIVLVLSTLLAFIFAIFSTKFSNIHFVENIEIFDKKGIIFIIALMGWMPTAVDMSVWNSIWTIERIKQTKYHPSLKETIFDFNVGYFLTILIAICFLFLGYLLFYKTSEIIPDSSSMFANKLISIYTNTLGKWSYWIISVSAFSVMFSTTLAVIDGYSRSIKFTCKLLFNISQEKYFNIFCLLSIISVSYLIIWKFLFNFKMLIDIATIISFLIAPFCAVINHILVHSDDIPIEKKPPKWLTKLSILGILFLIFFCIIFVVYV